MKKQIDLTLESVDDLEVHQDSGLYECPYCPILYTDEKNHGRFNNPNVVGVDEGGIKVEYRCEVCEKYLYVYYSEPIHAEINEAPVGDWTGRRNKNHIK